MKPAAASSASSTTNNQPLALLIEQLTARLQSGERLYLEKEARTHPQFAEQLAQVWPALQALAELSCSQGTNRLPIQSDPETGELLHGELGDFRLLREVGRGGMGVVYEAEQVSLGRRVALKILLFAEVIDPRRRQRFQLEARAAASLHHPNIVTVYAVGYDHGLHYYAMQLIDGRNLEDLVKDSWVPRFEPPFPPTAPTTPLSHKPDAESPTPIPLPTVGAAPPATLPHAPKLDREHFRRAAELGVQAAEALEHAHNLGIIHRDIKPANLLVDGSGHLWVTDFGLARTPSASDLTRTGDVVGTLRYMSPEQALAKHGLVDHRTDVYGLGATLYELLTLRPAIDGADRQNILQNIANQDPRPLRQINRAIPRDLETVILKALAKDPCYRYTTAREFADDLRRWLEDRPVLARRLPAGLRLARWARRHQTALRSAAAVALVAVVALGAAVRDATIRREAVTSALREADRLEDQGSWREALAEVRGAEGLLVGGIGGDDLRQLMRQRQRTLELVARLEEVRLERAAVLDERLDFVQVDRAYARAFQEYGLDVEAGLGTLGPEGVVNRFPQRVRQLVAAALDDWVEVRRSVHGQADALSKGLLAAARVADSDGGRAELRDALSRGDYPAVVKRASAIRGWEVPTATAVLVAGILRHSGHADEAATLLLEAQSRCPDDFWINLELSASLRDLRSPRYDEALRFGTVALALRPQSPHVRLLLGITLCRLGRTGEAVDACREAVRLEPASAQAHLNLGYALGQMGATDEAVDAYTQALSLRPDYAVAYLNLGKVLMDKGLLDEAADRTREALRIAPNFSEAHNNLGAILHRKGLQKEALAEYKAAIRLRPNHPEAHSNLGDILEDAGQLDGAIAAQREAIRLKPDFAPAHFGLGRALRAKGDLGGAITSYKTSLRLAPGQPEAQLNLGEALLAMQLPDEAIVAFKEALRLRPQYPKAHLNIGLALQSKGLPGQAVTAYREAVHQRPDFPEAHNSLGSALRQNGALDESVAAFKEAIRLRPAYPEAYNGLGHTLREKHDLDGTITAFREAIRLKPDRPESHNNLATALREKGLNDEAILSYREALRLRPGYVLACYNLGQTLQARGALDEAIVTFRETVGLQPDHAEAHLSLGQVLRKKGLFTEALTALRRGHKLGTQRPGWTLPSARWVRECERQCELDRRLPAVLKCEAECTDTAERVEFAELCLCKHLYAAAAQFFQQALAGRSELVNKPGGVSLYDAACTAALAGCGHGEDGSRLDDRARARWRKQALDWLRSDLASLEVRLREVPASGPALRQVLEHWRGDADLADLRDEAKLAALPRAEGDDWRKLWAEVASLMDRARGLPLRNKANPDPDS